MLETDIEILRTNLVNVLNAFLSWAGWVAATLLVIEFARKLYLARRDSESMRRRLRMGIVGMRASATYAILGFLLIYLTYAILNLLAGGLAPFCPSGEPFTTPLLVSLQKWGGLSGTISSCALVFSGFSMAISLGRSRWLLSMAKFLALASFFVFFVGMVLTCNLSQG